MKKEPLATILILALLFLFSGVATANPVWLEYFPTEPDTNPLLITVQSPTQNQTCNSTNVWLNFTVTKPESWFRREAPDDQQPNEWDKYMIIGKVTSAYYCLDGAEKQNVPGTYSKFIYEEGILSELSRNMDFAVNLSLPEGPHSITVSAEGESYYAETVTHYYSYLNASITDIGDSAIPVSVSGFSETVTFTVAEPPLPEPPTTFPAEIVAVASGASAIAIAAGAIAYLRRRKR